MKHSTVNQNSVTTHPLIQLIAVTLFERVATRGTSLPFVSNHSRLLCLRWLWHWRRSKERRCCGSALAVVRHPIRGARVPAAGRGPLDALGTTPIHLKVPVQMCTVLLPCRRSQAACSAANRQCFIQARYHAAVQSAAGHVLFSRVPQQQQQARTFLSKDRIAPVRALTLSATHSFHCDFAVSLLAI